MNRIQKKHSGVVIPMVTPVTEDFKIDDFAVASILKTFTKAKVNVFLLGTTGESTSVTESERKSLIQSAVDYAQNRIKVYAGVSSCCAEDTIRSANTYASMGVDAIVLHLPFYYPVDENNMVKYFSMLADKIKGPVILYNNPITVKQSIPVWVVNELSQHENIVGFKDSERGIDRLDECISLWKDREDFSFLLGWAAQSAYATLKGADGIVPSTGNLTPDLYKDLFEAAVNGNEKLAYEYQERTNTISEVYQKGKSIYESIPSLKVIMSEYGLCNPVAVPPMYAPDAEEQKALKANIRKELGDFTPNK